MVTWMRAVGGMCQSGSVPNCHPRKLAFRIDPLNPGQTDEDIKDATLRINEILGSLNPPPGDSERDTLVFVAEPDVEGDGEFLLLGLRWVAWRPDEQEPD
jgi:hypothetical protein